MWQILRRNPRALGAALLLHLLLAALLLIGVDWWATADKAPAKPRVVQATIVDSKAIKAGERQAEAERQAEKKAQRRAEAKRQAEETARRRAEAERKAEKKAQRQAEAKRQAEKKAQRRAEAKRQAEKKAQRRAEAKRQAEKKAQRRAEAKRQAEKKAQRQAEAKRQAEKETRRRAEAERKAAEQARRQAEAEAKRKAEAAEARRAREEELQAALEAEQAAGNPGIYTSAIRDRIRGTWVRQPGMGRDLSCLVEVRLIPGGEVVPASVRVIRGSGNPAFDRSVVTAVYKASPLPVPSGRSFEQFRNLRLTFKP